MQASARNLRRLRPTAVRLLARELRAERPSLHVPSITRAFTKPLNQVSHRGLLSALSRSNLSRLEVAANQNPQDVTAQRRFYDALVAADLPQILVERHETRRYATDSGVEDVYRRALENMGRKRGLAESTHVSVNQSGGSGAATAGNRTMSPDDIQAIGQAVAAHSRGQRVAYSSGQSIDSSTGQRKTPMYVVIEETIGATLFRWIRMLLYFVLTTYIGIQVLSLVIELFGTSKRLGGGNVVEAQAQHQTVRFSDVQGCEEAKEELTEVVDFLKAPDKFSALGGKLTKGVLLVGPPGTGKTLLARAVAGEAGVPFLFMSGSEFDEIFVGVGAKRVRELFTAARSKSPAIIFIDELDAVGGKRTERDYSYSKQTLNQLLVELDGFAQNSGIVLIAATNFPELLDKALTRPGRFDRRVTVPLPDVRGRIQILDHHLKKIQIGTDIDSSIIARGTPGFSGAELENVVNQAAVHASKNKAKKVSMVDIEWAKDKIIMGPESRSRVITDKGRLMTAYHEAGHALLAHFTEGADPVYKITILPRGEALGYTASLPEMDQTNHSKKQMHAHIDVCMGGKLAEAMIYGEDNVTDGAVSDLQKATNIARKMVCYMGMSDLLGNVFFGSNLDQISPETKKLIDNEVRRLVEEGSARAAAMLQEKHVELERLAKGLVEYETLNKEDFEKIINGEALTRNPVTPSPQVKLTESIEGLRPVGGLTAPIAAGHIPGGAN